MHRHLPTPSAPHPSCPPNKRTLFLAFLGLGLSAFGGALPLSRHLLVARRRWLSEDEFADLLGLCQFLPGGNVINLALAVGMRFQGAPGALAAMLGLIVGPTGTVLALGTLYAHFQHDATVQRVFAGLAAAAAGLMIATAIQMARPLLRQAAGAMVALLCVGAIALLRLPLLPTMLVLVPLGVLVAPRRLP